VQAHILLKVKAEQQAPAKRCAPYESRTSFSVAEAEGFII
jgi:hypothetical protein